MTTHSNGLLIRPYNIKELAAIYGVDRKTMSKWLEAHSKAIGPKIGYFYSALQVKIIFEVLGTPGELKDVG